MRENQLYLKVYVGVEWGIRYLGVFLGVDSVSQENWDGMLQKLEVV